MASKKFLVKNGLTTQNIDFVDNVSNATNTIAVSMLDSDTLSFSGDTGQLFSITDSQSGTIFAVNDISGVPSIEVDDDGTIRFAETFGNVLIGTSTDNGIDKVQISGDILADTFKGNLYGIANTAIALETPIDIALNGAVTGSASFDGSSNITITTTSNITLGTDTTGDYVSTISGTANEIEVTGSGSETASVTIGLPDEVTISNTLTVTSSASFVSGGVNITPINGGQIDAERLVASFHLLDNHSALHTDIGLNLASNKVVGWNDQTNSWSTVPDTGLARDSAGVVRVTTGTTGTGDLIANNLTLNGDLTVSGNTVSVNTTNLDVEDSIITLNKNQATPLNDIGFLFQRYSTANTTNYNVAIAWDEGADKLHIGKTSEDGSDNDLTFDTEWLTIDSAGNVGIGTTTPSAKLDITRDDGSTLLKIKNASSTRSVLQIGDATTNWGVIGGSDYNSNMSRLDLSANQLYLNGITYANSGNIVLGRLGDATAVSTQKDSRRLSFQNSFWNGSSHVAAEGWQLFSDASTTDAYVSDLSFYSVQDSLSPFQVSKTGLKIDGSIDFNYTVDAPSTTVTATDTLTAGDVSGTNIKYRVTFVTDNGETTGSISSNNIASATNTQIELTNVPVSSDPRVIARKIYRTSDANVNGAYFRYIGEISDNVTTTFTDNVTIVGGGGDYTTNIPIRNTTSGVFKDVSEFIVGSDSQAGKLKIYNSSGDNSSYGEQALEFIYNAVSDSKWLIFPSSTFKMEHVSGNSILTLDTGTNGTSGITFQGAGGRGGIYTYSSYDMHIDTNDTYNGNLAELKLNQTSSGNILMTNGGGRVGIGTSSPSAKLDVAETWNDANTTFTAIKAGITDTASNASSLLLDLQVDGSSNFSVDKAGNATLNTSFQRSIVFSNNLTDYEATAGELYWNPDDRTLDLETGGTLLQIGQEEYYLVKNQTGNTIPNGQAVMATGVLNVGSRILAAPAIADGSFPSKYFMGIATEDIANGEEGFVTQFGVVRQIDTGMFSKGDILYVDPQVPGGLRNTAPSAPNNIITAAIVLTSSNTTGSIFVRPSFTGKLQELEDLVLDNLADNAIITWSSSNSRFELVQHYSDSSVATYLDVSSATANQVLSWTGSSYDWIDQSAGGGGTDYGDSNVDVHLNTASAANNQVLSWTGTDYDWINQGSGSGSSVTTSDTAPVSPSDGDLWFNTTDSTLSVYYEDIDSGQWVVTSGPQGVPGTNGPAGENVEVYTANTPPESPTARSVWFNTDDASMYFYYDDATSNQWVAISGPTGPEGPQGPAGADGGGVTTGKAIAMAIVFGG